MAEQSVPEHYNESYILVQTLYEHLSAFKKVGLKIPEIEFINTIEAELLRKIKYNFQSAARAIDIETIPFSVLSGEIFSLANQHIRLFPDNLVISTAPLLAYESGGACVELSRLIDFTGKIIAIRP